ncbi:MAG: hypothetical protein U0Q15_07675 [Kineosporiaceae bacterium]
MQSRTTTSRRGSQSAIVSRRSFIAVSVTLLASGAVNATVSPSSLAASLLDLRALDGPLLTLPGPEGTLRIPRQLALEIVNGEAVPTGTQIEIRYDPRLFHGLECPYLLTAEGFRPLERLRDSAPGRVTVVLPRPLPAGTSARPSGVIVIATANAPYPVDLVRGPATSAATMHAKGRTVSMGRLQPLASQPQGLTRPWGVDISGTWRTVSWCDDAFKTAVPELVSLRSTGPGPLPAPPALDITLDRRVARHIEIASVIVNGRTSRRVGRMLNQQFLGESVRLTWQFDEHLRANDVLECGFDIACLTPTGPLPGFFHPLVAWAGHLSTVGQRLTAREEWLRLDCNVA